MSALASLFDPKVLLLLLLAAAVIVLASGGGSLLWISPSINNPQMPTNDCGQNYHIILDHPKNFADCLSVSRQTVEDSAKEIMKDNPALSFEQAVREILNVLYDTWRGGGG